MPTPVDDLDVGMYVAVVGERTPRQPDGVFCISGPCREYSGTPLEVLAISLPFLCVLVGDERMTLDMRRFSVQRLTPEYVSAVLGSPPPAPMPPAPRSPSFGMSWISVGEPLEAQLFPTCDRCGGRLVQRLYADSVDSSWVHVCPQCEGEG